MTKLLDELAVQSLIEHDGELIFSKEKFAELIVKRCVFISRTSTDGFSAGRQMAEHFGVEQWAEL